MFNTGFSREAEPLFSHWYRDMKRKVAVATGDAPVFHSMSFKGPPKDPRAHESSLVGMKIWICKMFKF